MPYSDRQLHCMRAMGLVPWTLREGTGGPATDVALDSQTPWPRAGSALQRLADSGHFHVGHAEAKLVVVVEPPADGGGGAPLDAEESQLFTLMLRAIGLLPRDTVMCVLARSLLAADPGGADPRSSVDAVTNPVLAELGNDSRRAALLLAQHGTDHHDADGHLAPDRGALGVPLWRIPHPAELLRRPLWKRGAWEVLKQLSRDLDAVTASTHGSGDSAPHASADSEPADPAKTLIDGH